MRKILGLFVLVLISHYLLSVCYAQKCEAQPLALAPGKIRTVGKALVVNRKPSNQPEYTSVFTTIEAYNRKLKGKCDVLLMLASSLSNGDKVKTPDRVRIAFVSTTYEYKFVDPKSRQLAIWIEGEKLFEGEMKLEDSRVFESKKYTETIGCQIDFSSFKKLAESNNVKMRLGSEEIGLTTAQLESFRDMLKAIEE